MATCGKCGAGFAKKSQLVKHLNRITPCNKEYLKPHLCTSCNKRFSSTQVLYRHKRQYCKQTVEQKSNTVGAHNNSVVMGNNNMIGSLHNGDVNVTIVNSFEMSQLQISVEAIREIFEENFALRMLVSDEKLAQVYGKPLHKYAEKALVEIVKKAHQSPENRNVYLDENNPKQVKILTRENAWLPMSLQNAQLGCLDSASNRLSDIACDDNQRTVLGIQIESSAMKLPNCYRQNKELILRETLDEMREHFDNLRGCTKKSMIKVMSEKKKDVDSEGAENKDSAKSAKDSTGNKIKDKSSSIESRIRTAIKQFLQSHSIKNVVDWDKFAGKALRNITTQSGAPKNSETESTIERYLWEFSQKDGDFASHDDISAESRKIAKKLRRKYAEKLQRTETLST